MISKQIYHPESFPSSTVAQVCSVSLASVLCYALETNGHIQKARLERKTRSCDHRNTFWDQLSRVQLTKRALDELNR
ncbi:hypothetical protein BJX63DRAFT_409180 [Aspergillus granulosus]|uniref:Uncharacterized protein n=1 Tax=Aspergillus granulosus TaxID=176169 RepID=A0ABR4GZ38_9EURO